MTVGVLHAEGLVDVIDFGGNKLIGDREQVDIIGFYQRVELTEGQEIAATIQAQHREHRLRPEYSAARQVLIPQPAPSSVERGIDPATHGVMTEVAFARAGRLPVDST